MPRTLSTNLDDPAARPYFVWDEDVTVAEVRAHLASSDRSERTLWMARVMREARYRDVWKLLRLRDVVADYAEIEPHLGRMRTFWRWLLDGWRDDGLLPES